VGSRSLRLLILPAALVLGALQIGVGSAATNWKPNLAASSSGEAQSQGPPGAPVASAACTSSTGKTISVSWSAVSKATSYSVYQSTTSGTAGYSLAASGVSGTTWTSASLSAGNYWYEVAAIIGSNWAGSQSSATGETTIKSGSITCTQP
jgi:hypothetical protein